MKQINYKWYNKQNENSKPDRNDQAVYLQKKWSQELELNKTKMTYLHRIRAD